MRSIAARRATIHNPQQERPRFEHVIDEICAFPWASLTSEEMADVARAYYFF